MINQKTIATYYNFLFIPQQRGQKLATCYRQLLYSTYLLATSYTSYCLLLGTCYSQVLLLLSNTAFDDD